jgi:hypothetical protein
MQNIISKAESSVKSDEEAYIFSLIVPDFRDKGVQILEQRSTKIANNPSLVYQEAKLAQRDLIKLCKSYTRRDLVKRGIAEFGAPGIISVVANYFLGWVIISGFIVIIKFFLNRIGQRVYDGGCDCLNCACSTLKESTQ